MKNFVIVTIKKKNLKEWAIKTATEILKNSCWDYDPIDDVNGMAKIIIRNFELEHKSLIKTFIKNNEKINTFNNGLR